MCLKYGAKLIQSRDINFKFHARFVLPLLCDTEYAVIFDDDTIPGERWLENCLRACREHGAVIGANGRILRRPGQDISSVFVGDGLPVEQDVLVDFVGHCWFMKSAWARCMWVDRACTWDNGEDIHLAASAQIYAGIPCFVPRMPADDRSLWGDAKHHYGNDDLATYKTRTHDTLRSEVISHWLAAGWRPKHLR